MEYKVLVAEDERAIASAISYALKREGFNVEMAVNGEDALKKAEAFAPTSSSWGLTII